MVATPATAEEPWGAGALVVRGAAANTVASFAAAGADAVFTRGILFGLGPLRGIHIATFGSVVPAWPLQETPSATAEEMHFRSLRATPAATATAEGPPATSASMYENAEKKGRRIVMKMTTA